MTVEKLTDEERELICTWCSESGYEGPKALRIIDAQASALAEARAECEGLRGDYGRLLDLDRARAEFSKETDERRLAAESRLAAANALLERVLKGSLGRLEEPLRRDIRAHLAGPASPAVPQCPNRKERAECEFGSHCPACREERGDNARTEAEQRVLDACAKLPLKQYSDGAFHKPEYGDLCEIMRAELARRGLKP